MDDVIAVRLENMMEIVNEECMKRLLCDSIGNCKFSFEEMLRKLKLMKVQGDF